MPLGCAWELLAREVEEFLSIVGELEAVLKEFSDIVVPSRPGIGLELSSSLRSIHLPVFFPRLATLSAFLGLLVDV